MKRVVFLLAAIAACVLCLCAFGSKVKVFSDNFDRPERFARYWNHNAGEVPGTVEYLPGGGADGGGCVKIASAEKTALAIKHKLTGLHPGKLYRLSALMKCDSVQDGRGAVLYLDPEGLEQSWNASEFAYGTNDWTEVYMDFVPDRQGEAVVCCGLGFPWGTYNGGKASGTVWYDNVKVTPAPEEALYTREGEHIVLKLDRDKVTVSDADIDAWLSKLDRTYEAYRDLVGDVPFDGRKIMILNTPGIEPGYWALAGNPILWNSHVAVSKLLDRTVEFGDWGFGIIHEIGHVFSQGNISGTGRWNWNDEIFANFRMSYALEACDGIDVAARHLLPGCRRNQLLQDFLRRNHRRRHPQEQRRCPALHLPAHQGALRVGRLQKGVPRTLRARRLGAGRARDALRQIPLLPLLRFEGRGRRCRGGDLYARGTGPDRGIA